MSKKRLKRIEAKLDLVLKSIGLEEEIDAVNKSIGGGGIKKPPTDTGG